MLEDSEDIDSLVSKVTVWLQKFEDLATTTKTFTVRSNSRPWFSASLKKQREAFLHEPDPLIRKALRNEYVIHLRKAKNLYTQSKASELQKVGGIWKMLKRNQDSFTDWNILVDGKNCQNLPLVVKEFKRTFEEKIESLKKDADCSAIIDVLRTRMPIVQDWDLNECSEEIVSHCIDSLKPSLSSGPDRITNRLIKQLKFELIQPLTTIFNCCICHGVFPQSWKLARILPVHKSGSRNVTKNFRPVAMVSNLGKLFERVVRIQFCAVLDKVLPDNIHGS